MFCIRSGFAILNGSEKTSLNDLGISSFFD